MITGVPLGPLRRVVVQATSFCNIDCRYCYLPDRTRRTVMATPVVAALGRALAASALVGEALEVRWHAGEPLAAPPSFYRTACALLADALAGRSALRFSVQTNGMLIDAEWCDLFTEYGFDVGVSIDGPAAVHDAYRRTRRDKGTHQRTMAGVDMLRRHGIPFSVISVVTPTLLREQDSYREFMAELRPASIGLNPEESEGAHRSDLFDHERFQAEYTRFLARMWAFQQRTGIPVRRFTEIRDAVLTGDLPVRNDQVEPLCLLTVDTAGNVGTYSPELLGWPAADYDDFVLGNVLDPDFELTAWPPGFSRMATAIEEGRTRCRETCGYFRLCGGGAAVNKWVENGSFATTVTGSCRLNTMAPVDVVLAALEG